MATDAAGAISCMKCNKCFEDGEDAFIARNDARTLIFLCYDCIYRNKIQPYQKVNMSSSRNGDGSAIDSNLLFRYIFQTNRWTDVISRAQNIREQLSLVDNITNSQLLLERSRRCELEQQLQQGSNEVVALTQMLNEKENFIEKTVMKKNISDNLLADRERDIQQLKEGLEDKERKCNAFEQAYRTIVEQLSNKNVRSAQQHSDAGSTESSSTPSNRVRLYDKVNTLASADPINSIPFTFNAFNASQSAQNEGGRKRDRGGGPPAAEAAGNAFNAYSRDSSFLGEGGAGRSFFESRSPGTNRHFNQG